MGSFDQIRMEFITDWLTLNCLNLSVRSVKHTVEMLCLDIFRVL